MSNRTDNEKNFTSSLITALSLLDHAPTREDVAEKARQLSEVFSYTGPLDAAIEEALVAIDTRMGAGTSLVDTEAEHDEEWVRKRKIAWTYSEGYEKYLKSEKWHPAVVQSLSDVSTRILGHLQDPQSKGAWDRRGLVIGHVQSGKTANYIGLVARAADAGYKFITVIAGIHNNLRKQTQERIDEGFVGRSSDPKAARETIGIGLTCANYPYPVTLTNIHKDFNKQTADQNLWSLNDVASKPIVLVIKKNVSTLKSLQRRLRELNTRGDENISDVPMLMIDDEADNASINTNKEDLDPTRTNSMLREILDMFAKSCYVGYTATPFANIFINPEAYDDKAKDELFPRDFIYCLDALTTYFGPEKVFLENDSSEVILQTIQDAEDYLPFSHRKDFEIAGLPPSLYDSIIEFVLVRTIRNLRGHQNRHCSMMVNVSRFVAIQGTVRDFISAFIKTLREAVKANYAMPDEVSRNNEYMARIEHMFHEQFSDCRFDWTDVKTSLFATFEHLRIFLVNSRSDEALDFKKYEKDGVSLTAIAIGGLSLSRGITIEGLSVSYMYRNTRMYDTLMQMGRWFGYRPGYEDLCRVHLSEDSIDWYAHISDASEELRQQIRQMRKDGLSPKDFGLYVKNHPDSLLITAANKMRSGETFTVKNNFSGRIRESYILPADEGLNDKNRSLIREYWQSGFGLGSHCLKKTSKGWWIENAGSDTVEQFLRSFSVHLYFSAHRTAHADYLDRISEKYPKCDVLLISLSDGENADRFDLGAQDRKSARLEAGRWRVKKDRVASRGDEKLGLSEEQQTQAQKLVEADNKQPSDFHYRTVRNKPLLMIHLLDLGKGENRQLKIPAYGISFPPGNYSESIEVVANKVWIDQIHGGTLDSPEEEDDYDE